MSAQGFVMLILAVIGGGVFTLLMGPVFSFTLIGLMVIVLIVIGGLSCVAYMNARDEFAARSAERRMAICFGFSLGSMAAVFLLSKLLR
jgi:hypothetical protein